MSGLIKKGLKLILPKEVYKNLANFKNTYISKYSLKSYSQEGEDLILLRIFERQKFGFYIDVGAHHPFRFSNTYLFYKRGWKGINIDATPGSMKLFNKFRKRDINLEIAVGEKEDLLTFYIFNEPALNTFDENLAKQRNGISGYFIIQKIPVKVYPLAKILEEYLPKGQEIDFMNIDVEGKDLEVLKGNDGNKFRPKVILVEILSSSLEEVFDNSTYTFLNENNYSLFAKTFNTCFFIENKFLEFLR